MTKKQSTTGNDSADKTLICIGINSAVKRIREEGLIPDDCTGLSNAIEELKKQINATRQTTTNDSTVDDLLSSIESYAKGIYHQGLVDSLNRVMYRFQDGTFQTKKVRNEYAWDILSECKRIQFTTTLPSLLVGDEQEQTIKDTFIVSLNTNFFGSR